MEYKRNNKLIKQTKKFKVPSEYLQRGPTGFGVVFTIANIKYAWENTSVPSYLLAWNAGLLLL